MKKTFNTDEKRMYVAPEIEVINFRNSDIIMSSTEIPGDDDE